ncbi:MULTISPECIES: hypothetical protein [unclassified Sphingobacterium]|nr:MULTISPECIES: hypothetical protein [unclassified Sphingobacterium]WKK60196.1 hypothetical protein QYC40_08100 [Sphingobacterium sp. BN32]
MKTKTRLRSTIIWLVIVILLIIALYYAWYYFYSGIPESQQFPE